MPPAIRLRPVPALLICALLHACGGSSSPGPTTGNIHVFVNVPVSPFDPDGSALSVDGRPPRAVPDSGTMLLEDLVPGSHELELVDVDEPCEVTSENPLTVTVSAGEEEQASFTIVCDNTASIGVATTTTGADIDPDGYLVSINGNEAPGIGVNDHVTYIVNEPGDYDVTLSGLAANCTIQGSATQSVTVAVKETAHLAFEVVCTAIP
jgi:hypothetical protein